MLPGSVEWVLEMLGFDWPKADEDKLRECAQVWRDFADQVDELNYRALSAANTVRSANSGDSVDAFGKAFDKFSTGGDGYLADAAMAARLIATTFDAAAVIVITCKIAVIAQLVILAAEIIAAQAAAPFTFGLSEVGALGATTATKMIVRRLLKELREALVEAVVETLKEPVVSAVQGMISDLISQTVNQGFGAQDGYDLGRTAKRGAEDFKDAAKNSGQTFTEALRDGVGSRAGGAARRHLDNAAGHGDSSGDHGSDDGGSDDRGSDDADSGRSNGRGESTSSSEHGSDGPGTSGSSAPPSSGGSSSRTPSGDGGGPTNSPTNSRAAEGGNGDSSAAHGDTAQSGPSTDRSTAQPIHDGSRTTAPLDPFGTRLTSDPEPAPSHTPAGSDGARPSSPSSSPPPQSSGTDAGAPTHTGTDGRSEPAGDGGTRPAEGGSATPRDGSDHRPAPASDGASPSPHTGTDGRGADAPARTGTDARPEPAGDNTATPAGRDASDSRSTPPSTPTTPDGHPGAGATHATPDATPSPAPSSAPAHGPVRGADDTPAHNGATPAYGPVRGGDGPTPVPAHQAPENVTTRPTADAPGHTAPAPHGGTDPRTAPAGVAPHVPAPDGTPPATSDGPHRAAGVQTASTVVADPPTSRTTPTVTPDPGGPAGQQTGNPTATGPVGPGAGVPTAAPTAAPTAGGTTTHRPGAGPVARPPADGPAADRPAVPGQQGRRPEQADRPVSLGRQPVGGRPAPDRPARTPDATPDTTPRPDPRAAYARPSADQPSDGPSAERPTTDRPKSDDHAGPDERPHADGPSTHADPTAGPAAGPEAAPAHDRPISASRPHDTPGGLAPVDPRHQQDLESRIPRNPDGTPQRHPDPRGDWPGAVNGDGHRAPGRDNNCLDVALSSADTYSGNPTAAAPRSDDGSSDGERGGRDRAERQLGAPFRDLGNGDQAYHRLEEQLRRSGHGSQAVIITQDAHGRAHAWNVVNHNGKITYLDNQTGARGDRPLHDGRHGVWAVPLDPNRRPLPPTDHGGDRPGDHGTRPDPATGGTDRRPADPAGKHKAEEEGDTEADGSPPKKKPKPDDDGQAAADRQGSAPYNQHQSDDQTHRGMLPDNEQQVLRRRENARVEQTDLDVAYDFLAARTTDKSLGDFLQETADRARANADLKDDEKHQLGFDHDELVKRLPDFGKLSPGERGAVLSTLGRLSLAVHRDYAVGASPEHVPDPYHYREDHDRSKLSELEAEAQQNDKRHLDPQSRGVGFHERHDFWTTDRGNLHRPLKPGEKPRPPDPAHLVRRHLTQQYYEQHAHEEGMTEAAAARAVRKQTVSQVRGDHRPDFSGKNFAVIETVDADNKVRYVIDTSIPLNTFGWTSEHSEPHEGRWMERLNQRAETGNYTTVNLWTEREPCGQGQGHGHCSDYLTNYMPEVNVEYGVGYRKGPMAPEHDTPAERAAAATGLRTDMQDHLNRLGEIWVGLATSGELDPDRPRNQHKPPAE
ncbi:toxin glutamine deamidase domain-containing protein [Kitasatospora sp. NBC_00374]|uniref:toxin glutamine deamidase domain-containing protein n=1 Tax=Kitasatospora sp. NBC_00374 TaxID=2975964 RepID=UPI00324F7183